MPVFKHIPIFSYMTSYNSGYTYDVVRIICHINFTAYFKFLSYECDAGICDVLLILM